MSTWERQEMLTLKTVLETTSVLEFGYVRKNYVVTIYDSPNFDAWCKKHVHIYIYIYISRLKAVEMKSYNVLTHYVL
jgi:hypothetical protein